MRRRALVVSLAAAVAAGPVRAQQADRMRRIGALFPLAADHPEQAVRRAALEQGLDRLGWSAGRTARFDLRFDGNPNRFAPLA